MKIIMIYVILLGLLLGFNFYLIMSGYLYTTTTIVAQFGLLVSFICLLYVSWKKNSSESRK